MMKQPPLALIRSKINAVSSSVRRRYLKALGLKIKAGGSLGRIKCEWPANVTIGGDCNIQDDVVFWVKNPFSNDNRIVLGDRVFIGRNCEINCNSVISIGDDCLIGSNTIFADINHQIDKRYKINVQPVDKADIVLEEDVWIGAGCIILKGVRIGKGSVVGAGSLINKSVPDYEIWAGTPARKIGERKEI
ncbi:acyltransferase [Pedobacter hartonius]|nr:acyltransferase [Pedobacter hartonius]